MKRQVDRFIRLVKAEAQDLQADLESLQDQQRLRCAAGEITDHVCKENVALFGSEIKSIDAFMRLLGVLDLDRHETVDEVSEEIVEAVKNRLEGRTRCPCIVEQLERKMEKVRRYVVGEVLVP